MKIIVASVAPWDKNNNFGRTFSDIFEGMADVEFLNIYCASGRPNNNVKASYYQITFQDIVKNLLKPSHRCGRVVTDMEDASVLNIAEMQQYNRLRAHPLRIFLWLRRFVWWIGRWRTDELQQVLKDFDADIAFIPIFKETYMNAVQEYILKTTGVKAVAYYGDDNYSLRVFSLNPFFWMDRLAQRRMVYRTVKQCEYMYVVSDFEKAECERDFQIRCKICTKGADFSNEPDLKKEYRKEKRLVYTGNLGNHRWEELVHIGEALDRINEGHKLMIYSGTPLSGTMKQAIDGCRSIEYMGRIPAEAVPAVQKDADILVHVESFRLKERLLVHQSFSTKLVDHFANARCTFGVGGKDVAFVDYLINHDAGIVATNRGEIESQLRRLLNDDALIQEYAIKGFECGRKMHDIHSIQSMLRADFERYLGAGHEGTDD